MQREAENSVNLISRKVSKPEQVFALQSLSSVL